MNRRGFLSRVSQCIAGAALAANLHFHSLVPTPELLQMPTVDPELQREFDEWIVRMLCCQHNFIPKDKLSKALLDSSAHDFSRRSV